MRRLIYLPAISILFFYSCDTQKREASRDAEVSRDRKVSANSKISIDGKWYRWSKENGYSEYDIDSKQVVVFNEKMGRNELEYTIENDTFRYRTIDYAAKISVSGDSIVLQDGERIAILKRFNESDPVFHKIPDEHDVASFDIYIRGFDERAAKYPKLTNVMEGGMPVRE